MTVWHVCALLYAWLSGGYASLAICEQEDRRKNAGFAVLYLLCMALAVWVSVTQ